MAQSLSQKLKRKKMSSNDTNVEDVSGYVIGLGITSGNKTSWGGAQVEVLDETCIVCCGDSKCWRHRDVILEIGGCAKAEEVRGCVIGLGIRSGAGGCADATQATQKKKKKKKKPRNFVNKNNNN